MSRVGPARGILRHPPAPGRFHHARLAPPDDLADLVQHFWIVRWDLQGGPPQVRETLPHPNIHLTVEDGQVRVHGVHTGRFTTRLRDRGGVFGIKFRAGAFRAVLGRPVSTLRNRSVAVEQALAVDASGYRQEILDAGEDDACQVAAAVRFLQSLPHELDATARQVRDMVERIEQDRGLLRVEQAADAFGINRRSLQRLFTNHVGVGPKWVIQRYRLHEAIERLAHGEPADWTRLALDLGYFDQAHFIRDFRALIGRSPGDYASR